MLAALNTESCTAVVKRAVLNIRMEPAYRRKAFEQMVQRLGYTISAGVKPAGPEDLLVTWNRMRGAEDARAKLWEQQGGTVLVTENGYLQREKYTHYALSVHGHNGSGWFPIGAEDRFAKLGFEVKPYRDEPGHALICGQRGLGSSVMASPSQWGEKAQIQLTEAGVKCKLRQHPGTFKNRPDLMSDLKGARSCVIWSSGAGVRAMVEGIPVFYDAPHWICSDAAWRFVVGLIKNPPRNEDADRQKALHKMSHGQWHHEELATGEPLARILAHLGEAKW